MRNLRVGVLVTLLLAGCATASAQSIYGSISGKVMDPSGAVIPRAAISIKNMETGLLRSVDTDGAGLYRVQSLPVGRYQIEFSATGFEKIIRGPIEVAAVTKHEGFKWVKRKHYYDVTLNPPTEA